MKRGFNIFRNVKIGNAACEKWIISSSKLSSKSFPDQRHYFLQLFLSQGKVSLSTLRFSTLTQYKMIQPRICKLSFCPDQMM